MKIFMSNNHGLGRGLASLIPKKSDSRGQNTEPCGTDTDKTQADTESAPTNAELTQNDAEEKNIEGNILEVPVNLIIPNPHQPRVSFDEGKMEGLAQSIKNHGIIQPLVVSKNGSQYEIIAGERRFQAAKKAGLGKVPVIVREAENKEKLELALIENIQRHDLNSVEEARAYKKLMEDFQMSQEEIARKVGKSRSGVANKIRLLNLPIEVQRAIIEGKITEGHAKAILALENQEKQRALFELIMKNKLTVRQTENKTKEVSVRSHTRTVNVDPELKDLENKLTGILGTRVKVSRSGGGGKIVIEYYSKEELNNILNKIKDS